MTSLHVFNLLFNMLSVHYLIYNISLAEHFGLDNLYHSEVCNIKQKIISFAKLGRSLQLNYIRSLHFRKLTPPSR